MLDRLLTGTRLQEQVEIVVATLVEVDAVTAARPIGAASTWRGRAGAGRATLDAVLGEGTIERLEWAISSGVGLKSEQAVVEATRRQESERGVGRQPEWFGLNDREIDVLRPVVDGRPDREIADELLVSPRTVGGHVANIRNKLGLYSRAAAAAFAVRHTLV